MKKIFIGCIVGGMFVFGMWNANAKAADAEKETVKRQDSDVRVYYYKLGGKKMPAYTPIYMNGYKITGLKKECYTYVDIEPGRYEIQIVGARTVGKETGPTNMKIYLEEGEYYFQISLADAKKPRKYSLDLVEKEKAKSDIKNFKQYVYEKKKKPRPLKNVVLTSILNNIDKREIYSEGTDIVYRDKNLDFSTIEKVSISPLIDAREKRKHSLGKIFHGFQFLEKQWDEKGTHLLNRIKDELLNRGYIVEVLDGVDEKIRDIERSGNYDIAELSKIGSENAPIVMLPFVNEVRYVDLIGKSFDGIKITFVLVDSKRKNILWIGQGSIGTDDMLPKGSNYGGLMGAAKAGAHASIAISDDKGLSAVKNGLKNFPNCMKDNISDMFENVYVEYILNYGDNTFTFSEKDLEKRKNKFKSKLKKIGVDICEDPSEAKYIYNFVFNDVQSALFLWDVGGSYLRIIDTDSSRAVFISEAKNCGTGLGDHEKYLIEALNATQAHVEE